MFNHMSHHVCAELCVRMSAVYLMWYRTSLKEVTVLHNTQHTGQTVGWGCSLFIVRALWGRETRDADAGGLPPAACAMLVTAEALHQPEPHKGQEAVCERPSSSGASLCVPCRPCAALLSAHWRRAAADATLNANSVAAAHAKLLPPPLGGRRRRRRRWAAAPSAQEGVCWCRTSM